MCRYRRARTLTEVLARLLARSAATVDKIVGRAITQRSPSARANSKSESLGHGERMIALAEIAESYEEPARATNPDAFFGRPSAFSTDGVVVGRRSSRHGPVHIVDVRWSSRVEPYLAALSNTFMSVSQNHDAAARLYLGREGSHRPAVILIHGYRGGRYTFAEGVWPVRWFLDHGVDIALFVLPFHSIRSAPGSGPRFPGSDPRFTNEGFRQAIGDLRDLVATFRDRGAEQIGVMGMSLGGYTASLLSTIEPLTFSSPIIPLASFADIALASGRLVGTPEEQLAQHGALDGAHAVVSPFTRPVLVPKGNVIVVAGEGDQITPMAHANKLADHLAADLVTFPGGHILQFGRSVGFRALGDRLRTIGVFRD